MTRDQFLTEKVLGDYWETCVGLYRDGKKVKDYQEKNPNFSTPEGFFKLWNFCKEQEWWEEFVNDVVEDISENNIGGKGQEWWHRFIDYFINPDTFADAIYNFRQPPHK